MTSSNLDTTRKPESATTVVVGVGGGIAAYKTAYLVRHFRKQGWDVHVVPTASALEFVGKATWEELSENPVDSKVFADVGPGHVRLARRADLIVVAPTTANLLAKFRSGIVDNLLTATVLASPAPLVLAPAMHTQMWLNPATQENVATLRSWGVTILEPDAGDLSSGDSGLGRLPDPVWIAEQALKVWHASTAEGEQPLDGKTITITAGGTKEPIDPVRYIGNRSSGHQGVALAEAALDLGAQVNLVAASMEVAAPEHERLRLISAESAAEMLSVVDDQLLNSDALIMAAAVADFTPVTPAQEKIKKTADMESLTVELSRTTDILASVTHGSHRPQVVVGFGAETGSWDRVLELGAAKARSKAADLLAVNRVGANTGFGNVPNKLVYFDAAGQIVGETSGSKSEVARDLMRRVAELLQQKD